MIANTLCDLAEVNALIANGRTLLVAGTEELLSRLNPGIWIGGSAVSFMGPDGGVTDRDHIFVTDLTDVIQSARVVRYRETTLKDISADYQDDGFSVLIVPGLSPIHSAFAHEAQGYSGIFHSPLIGWVSAVDVSEIGSKRPTVFAGSGDALRDEAVAMHVLLKPEFAANIDMVNVFVQGDGPAIEFDEDCWSTGPECHIDGERMRLSDYIVAEKIDTRLPLVGIFGTAMINVSIRSVNQDSRTVDFYSPAFKGVQYRFAKPVADYTAAFDRYLASREKVTPAYSCNCLLNFLYADLKGKRTGDFMGPITFGEIAYVLMSQTLVYLRISEIG
jgi:hypothetical protein